MTAELFADGRVQLHCGDCLDVLATLPECSVDAVVTDPPYHLTSIVKRFGADNAAPAQYGSDGVYARATAGFMGQCWDGGDVAFRPSTWAAVFRVLRPGGYLLAMGGTRTHHRLACAIEDAGFEIRDMIAWLYGSGFPKSHDVSKAIDRMLGVEREQVRHDNPRNPKATGGGRDGTPGATRPWIEEAMERGYHEFDSDVPATWAARQWDGWGSSLKPAMEPCCLARKPLDGTISENVMKHGTGALNIDSCRVPSSAEDQESQKRVVGFNQSYSNGEPSLSLCGGVDGSLHKRDRAEFDASKGRWPANVMHDGSPEVLAAFPETGISSGDSGSAARYFASFNGRDGEASAERRYTEEGATNFAALPGARRESVPPSRLFYSSKADRMDRIYRFIETATIEWNSQSDFRQVKIRLDADQLHEKAIVDSPLAVSSEWSTFLCGNFITDLFQKASKCIIRTATSLTTESKIWSLLMTLSTSASIADVKYETVNGGSLVASAEIGIGQVIIISDETVFLPGAVHVASGTPLKISVSGRSHSHPTCKPIDLMQYLVRLICPPNGTVLDPFAGTGTTAEAALREGMRAILIEREAQYCEDIRRRMRLAFAGPDERCYASIKARGLTESPGPLFDGWEEAAE